MGIAHPLPPLLPSFTHRHLTTLFLPAESSDRIAQIQRLADTALYQGRRHEAIVLLDDCWIYWALPLLMALPPEGYMEARACARARAKTLLASLARAHLSVGQELEANEAADALGRFDPDGAAELRGAMANGKAVVTHEERGPATAPQTPKWLELPVPIVPLPPTPFQLFLDSQPCTSYKYMVYKYKDLPEADKAFYEAKAKRCFAHYQRHVELPAQELQRVLKPYKLEDEQVVSVGAFYKDV